MEDGFIRGLRDNPCDDGLRLVYADWLEEQGDPRGEYLRVECELLQSSPTDRRLAKVQARFVELRRTLDPKWRALVTRLPIRPGSGIGPIVFGMSPATVRAVFDEDQLYEDWMGGNLNDALLFHGLRLHFDVCDRSGPLPHARLAWIVVHNREDALLFGRPMSIWTKAGIIQRFIAEGYSLQSPGNGDVVVLDAHLEMSFDECERLIWLEMS